MSQVKAYCLNCHESVEPNSKKTILLANNSRALKGNCPKCQQEVYRFMPKKKIFQAPDRRQGDQKLQSQFPDAWCFKCKKFTPTKNQNLVMMENNRVAVQGQCSCCGSAVSRVLGKKDMNSKKSTNLQLVHSEPQTSRKISHKTPPPPAPRKVAQNRMPTELPKVIRRNHLPGWVFFTLGFLSTFSILMVALDIIW